MVSMTECCTHCVRDYCSSNHPDSSHGTNYILSLAAVEEAAEVVVVVPLAEHSLRCAEHVWLLRLRSHVVVADAYGWRRVVVLVSKVAEHLSRWGA